MIRILVTGASTELGSELLRQLSAEDHVIIGLIKRPSQTDSVSRLGGLPHVLDASDKYDLIKVMYDTEPDVILNVLPQWSNTLLHDGLAWRNVHNSLPAQTAALLHAANDYQVSYLVHTSFAFLYGATHGREGEKVNESTPINPPSNNRLLTAAAACEDLVSNNNQFPVSILRLGYLYGPQSRDLALYDQSFQLRRPYYAGSKNHLANFVHFNDAARAIARVANKKPAKEIFNIVDGTPTSFGSFIDYYAQCLGYKRPRRLAKLFARLAPIITRQQLQQLDIRAAPVDNSKARKLLGWIPEFTNYKIGLQQTAQVQRGRTD
ncbi:MAG: NAD(P)-dependent oxidoreductase [Candidatus Promineifilaceae bacterium]|nr:NAD(P)-dependent oxidoreductase [Candidatus Promineifilaceae bacterium]